MAFKIICTNAYKYYRLKPQEFQKLIDVMDSVTSTTPYDLFRRVVLSKPFITGDGDFDVRDLGMGGELFSGLKFSSDSSNYVTCITTFNNRSINTMISDTPAGNYLAFKDFSTPYANLFSKAKYKMLGIKREQYESIVNSNKNSDDTSKESLIGKNLTPVYIGEHNFLIGIICGKYLYLNGYMILDLIKHFKNNIEPVKKIIQSIYDIIYEKEMIYKLPSNIGKKKINDEIIKRLKLKMANSFIKTINNASTIEYAADNLLKIFQQIEEKDFASNFVEYSSIIKDLSASLEQELKRFKNETFVIAVNVSSVLIGDGWTLNTDDATSGDNYFWKKTVQIIPEMYINNQSLYKLPENYQKKYKLTDLYLSVSGHLKTTNILHPNVATNGIICTGKLGTVEMMDKPDEIIKKINAIIDTIKIINFDSAYRTGDVLALRDGESKEETVINQVSAGSAVKSTKPKKLRRISEMENYTSIDDIKEDIADVASDPDVAGSSNLPYSNIVSTDNHLINTDGEIDKIINDITINNTTRDFELIHYKDESVVVWRHPNRECILFTVFPYNSRIPLAYLLPTPNSCVLNVNTQQFLNLAKLMIPESNSCKGIVNQFESMLSFTTTTT